MEFEIGARAFLLVVPLAIFFHVSLVKKRAFNHRKKGEREREKIYPEQQEIFYLSSNPRNDDDRSRAREDFSFVSTRMLLIPIVELGRKNC